MGQNDNSPSPATPNPKGNSATEKRPSLNRVLSPGYTHVFNPRPSDKLPASTKLYGTARSPSLSQEGIHTSVNSTNQFHSGLDWLLDATKEAEKRPTPTLRGTPLTEGSLREWNQSELPRRGETASNPQSEQTRSGSSSGATTQSASRDKARG